MPRDTRPLVLPLLLALGCSLAGGTAAAAYRPAPKVIARCSGNWLSQLLGRLPVGASKSGLQVDPNGSGCRKSGYQVDPNGQPDPNKSGSEFDPNGSGPAKP